MPKNVAQFTGVMVTAIIVFGTDMDVFYAMPLGIFAGALATFFVVAVGSAARKSRASSSRDPAGSR